jgi:hypothetical protein
MLCISPEVCIYVFEFYLFMPLNFDIILNRFEFPFVYQ